MLFVTNRRLLEGRRSEAGRRISFDLADDEPGASVYFCEREGPGAYRELLSGAFFGRLRRSAARQVLLYAHGFHSQPEDPVFPNATLLQALCDEMEPGLVEVVPILWPCHDERGLVLDYYDDQVAADVSGLALARVLAKFVAWRDRAGRGEACLRHVNVLAHSMGNRVLRGALAAWAHDYGIPPALFRAVFMAAPDLANDCLEPGRDGEPLADCTRNLVVYHAADDLALRSSKVANMRHKIVRRRLGHTGPADPARCARNVASVDCDAFNNACDPFGHSYYLAGLDGRPGPLLRHMVETIATGRVPGAVPGVTRILLPEPANDALPPASACTA